MIAIIDYGMGNIHSVQKALEHFGAKTRVISKAEDLDSCDKAVLPGVGAFCDAMKELQAAGLDRALHEYIKSKRPFLGICLGMQLLFSESQEAPGTRGMGVLAGRVRRFDPDTGIKIPHMGWNRLHIVRRECPIMQGIPEASYVYFCHSYYPENQSEEQTAAACEYGISFTTVVWKENVYGVQFHPEKSQATGLKMLDNFVHLC